MGIDKMRGYEEMNPPIDKDAPPKRYKDAIEDLVSAVGDLSNVRLYLYEPLVRRLEPLPELTPATLVDAFSSVLEEYASRPDSDAKYVRRRAPDILRTLACDDETLADESIALWKMRQGL